MSHKYYGVDLDVIWTTVERDLPALRTAIESILASDGELAD